MTLKIILTGATGYVGSNLFEFFRNDGIDVIPISREKCSFPVLQNNICPEKNDISRYKIGGGKIGQDLVFIHCAASISNEFEVLWESNVLFTKKCLDFCRTNGIRKFIHFSTGSVYLPKKDYVAKETDLPSPKSAYSLTKLMSEKAVEGFYLQGHLNAYVLRLYYPFGGHRINGIFRLIRDSIRDNKTLYINKFGSPFFKPVHLKDLCLAVRMLVDRLLESEKKCFEIFNVCGDATVNIQQVIDHYAKIFEVQPRLEKKKEIQGDTIASNEKIKNFIHWTPKEKCI